MPACAPRWTPLAAVLLLGAATPLQAQDAPRRSVVRGHLLDMEALVPVADADITLLAGDERVVRVRTNGAGFFTLEVPRPGSYRLEASRIGYGTVVTDSLDVTAGDTITVEFHVLPDAIPMQPLIVTARTNRGMNQFLRRMEEWGEGIYMTPAHLDSLKPWHWGDVFRGQETVWLSWGWGDLGTIDQVPRGRNALGGGRMSAPRDVGPKPRIRTYQGLGCLNFVVDGRLIGDRNRWILESLKPKDIIAVEVYRSFSEIPPELRKWADQEEATGSPAAPFSGSQGITDIDFKACGLAMYWTRLAW